MKQSEPFPARPVRAPLIAAVAWAVALGVVLVGQWFRIHMEQRAAGLTFPLHPDEYRQGPAMLQYAAILGTWIAKNPFEVDHAAFSAGLAGFAFRTALGALIAAALVSIGLYSGHARRLLRDYFATPGSALDLAAFRVIFAFMFFNVSDAALKAAHLPAELMVPLKDPLPLWRLIRPDPLAVTVATTLLRAGCVAAVVGFYPRLAAAIVTLAVFYVEGVGQLFGKVNHCHHLVWTSAVLAAAPLGDALSLPRLLPRGRGGAGLAMPAPSVAYSRPIRIVWLIMGVVYFYPGFWKAITGGSAWIFSDNLLNRMFQKWSDEPGFVPLFRGDHFPGLLSLGAFGTLVFELGFVFLVLAPQTRYLAAAMGFGFHNMTRLLMNIAFWPLQIMYASFIPWQRLLDRFSAQAAPPTTPRGSLAAAAQSARLTTWTGAVVLGLAVLYGTAHLDTAWPFACYPTFDAYLGDRVHDLGAYYLTPDGRERAVPEDKLLQSLGASRLRTLRRGIVYDRNAENRQKSLEAFVAGADSARGDAVAIRFYDETRSLVPEVRARGPVSRVLLHSVSLEQR